MTPDQFLSRVQKGSLAPAYLFLGPEIHQRDDCRRELVRAALGDADPEDAFVRHDLEELTVANVVDDAQSFSLFAPKRVLWVSRAEGAVPKGRAAAAAEDEEGGSKPAAGGAEALGAYLRNPAPGVTIVFDSAKFDFDGEDKAKAERVRKFFAAIPDVVEFPRWTPVQARKFAQDMARAANLRIAPDVLNGLVEAVGNAPSRVKVEIEKLSLYAGPGGSVSDDDVAKLAPQAHATTIFALVGALGRRDRTKALELLDVLVREGEYLPIALQFLATQFRHAIVAQEAGLRSASQIQGYFAKQGVPMWPSKAEQISQTATAFAPAQLRRALERVAKADSDLKDIRPDERTVLENFVVNLTAR